MRSKKVTLVLLDGTPYGIRSAELSNWNGKLIVCPRAALKKLKEFPESTLPAVYFLTGDENKIYIGETDTLGQRLSDHAFSKEFWNEVIAFTSSKLTKAEVKYLECVFVKRLKNDGLAEVLNATCPKIPSLSPEDRDAMDEFVDHASDILLALGYQFMGASKEVEDEAKKGIKVFCKGPAASAEGIWGENGLLILQGSKARKNATPTIPGAANRFRNDLILNGGLKSLDSNEESYILEQNQLFPSASVAAEVILGRSANGLVEWKTEDGKTIKSFED